MEMTTTQNEIRLKECQKESKKTIVSGETFFIVARACDFDYEKAHLSIRTLSSKGLTNDGIYNYYATKKHLA